MSKFFILLTLFGILSGQNLIGYSPDKYRISTKNESLTISLDFSTDVNDAERSKTYIVLESRNCSPINITNKERTKENNLKKIEYFYPDIDIKCYGVYNITFYYENNPTKKGYQIYIYLNDVRLKKPKDKYFLVKNSNSEKVSATFDLELSVPQEAISRINCVNKSNPLNNFDIKEFEIEGSDKLKITINRTAQVVNYACNIYPRSSLTTISAYQQFTVSFHEYLLETEAVYFDKDTDNKNIMFKLRFNDSYDESEGSRLIIQEGGYKEINYTNKICDGNYCEFFISPGAYSLPGTYKLFYKKSQERQLYYILYKRLYSERCYNKATTNELISIFFYWPEEMDYSHYVFFHDTSSIQIHYYIESIASGVPSANYSITMSEMKVGLFSVKSSIPALSYTDYNPVDPDKLYISVIADISVTSNNKIILYKNNRTDQILNMTFSERDTIGVLDELTFKEMGHQTNQFTLYKSRDECKDSNSLFFYCNLTDYIRSKELEIIKGNYTIQYSDICQNLAEIKDLTLEIRQTYNLISFEPIWVNLTKVNKTNITLIFDDTIEGNINAIEIFNKSDNLVLNLTTNDKDIITIEGKTIVISLNDTFGKGVYKVNLLTDLNIDYHEKNRFKISNEDINFNFSHHYFVLNSGSKQLLKIYVTKNSEDFGCKLQSSSIQEPIINKTADCTYYELEITKIGVITFNYYDSDNILIPIDDNITVVDVYTNLFSFFSPPECYYYKFDLLVQIVNAYSNANLIIFLEKEKDNEKILLTKNNNNFTIADFNLSNNNYNLFVSEAFADDEVYLYKSGNIVITQITVPEYIIKPDKIITFRNITCDLSRHNFLMVQNQGITPGKRLENCNYNQGSKTLSCNILGFNYNNNNFGDYYFNINDKIIDDEKGNVAKTFVSNRLNETDFNLKEDKVGLTYSVTIRMIGKYFYFPLITHLTNYKSGQNTAINLYRENKKDILIDDENGMIKFNITLEFDAVYNISHLTRSKGQYETIDVDESFYHYFNYTINNTLFRITPTIFAYNVLKPPYEILISYNNLYDLNLFNETKNLTKCREDTSGYDRFDKRCNLDIENNNFIPGIPQNFVISIGNNVNKTTANIRFIYYQLSENSKKCQTKTSDMPNIILEVNCPDRSITNSLELIATSMTCVKTIRGNDIEFSLNGEQDAILQGYLELYINNDNFYHSFSLKEIGLNVLPLYNFYLKSGEAKLYLFPINGQEITVSIDAGKYSTANIDDINKFEMRNRNNVNIIYELKNSKVDSTRFNIIFDLKGVSQGNYDLYYYDKCQDPIKTNLEIIVTNYKIDRQYFVLNNNHQVEQKITLSLGYDIVTNISLIKDNINIGKMNYDQTSKKYYHTLKSDSAGDYKFQVDYKEGSFILDELVYVRKELSDLINIVQQPPSCIYYKNNNGHENIAYSISPASNSIVKDISIFNSYLNGNSSSPIVFVPRISNNIKYFELELSNTNNNINRNYFIFLTEKADKEQPLYVFKYSYTNITLKSDYSQYLYTDISYIEFIMSCKLPGNLTFTLSKVDSDNKINFKCDSSRSIYNSSLNTYKCQLYITAGVNENNFLKYDYEGGIYNLMYSTYLIQGNIFLSYEISKINFKVDFSDPVMPEQNKAITLQKTNHEFYMTNIESVKYEEGGASYERLDARINRATLNLSLPYFTCSIYIKKKIRYKIYEVCRKECKNCFGPDCTTNIVHDRDIISNVPEVYFDFDKHYINLNSEYDNNINIKVSGDAEELQNIYYNYFSLNNQSTNGLVTRRTTYEFILRNLNIGKYVFYFNPNDYPSNITIQNGIVIVTRDFTDLLVFHDDSNDCLFYKKSGSKGIMALITIREDYPFINDVPISDFDLYVDDNRFPYANNLGYQMLEEYEYEFYYNDDRTKTINIVEKNVNPNTYIFGKIQNKIITSFDIDEPINYKYFYKDNIVLKNIYCPLKNIYIQSSTNLNEQLSQLECEYDRENRNAYCSAINYNFIDHYSDDFELFIGYKMNKTLFTYDLQQSVFVYNSINTSNFSVYFIYPNLTVYSDNFYMNHTFSISIDNIVINRTNITDIFEKYIILTYKKNISDFNYLTEITRIPHEKDRPSFPPKNKALNLTILSCPKYQKFYEGLCQTCFDISKYRTDQRRFIWYQNGECVEECVAPYYIFESRNYYCEQCAEKTKIGDKIVCGCLDGTVLLEEDNICYLPDSQEILDDSLINPNIMCYRGDGETHNFCNKNNTDNCIITSRSGRDNPECQCKEGYIGKYCEQKIDRDINLEESNLIPILDNVIEDQIDENNTNTIAKIRGMIYFLELDNNYNYMQNINTDNINQYIDSTVELLKNSVNRNSIGFQIYDIIELGVYFLNYKINNEKDVSDSDKNDLEYMLNQSHYANYMASKDKLNFNIYTDKLNLITFISYRNDALDNSFKNYIKMENQNSDIIGYIDLVDNYINKNEMLVNTVINRNLYNTLENVKITKRYLEENNTLIDQYANENGITIIFSSANKDTDLKKLTNFKVYIHSSNLNVNYDLANYYQQYDIGIYNRYDDCFVEPCYFNKKLDFDLTQIYRKKYLYQKVLLSSINCKYNSFDLETNNIEFICSKFDDFGKFPNTDVEYGRLDFTFKQHHIEDENKEYKLLPFRCTNKIDNLADNIGFRVYLVIMAIELVYIIAINILSMGGLRNYSIKAGLDNDRIFRFSHTPYLNSVINLKIDNNNNNNNNNNYIDIYNNYDSLFECFWNNLMELHPLFCLIRVSLIQPLILHSWFFVFNVLGLFGFNALLYWEGFIEERIYKPYRDNFAYPMRKEFGKILLSILCQLVLCFLIKLIVLVPYQKIKDMKIYGKKFNNDLNDAVKEKENEVPNFMMEKVNMFEKNMFIKRIIGGILMLLIITFFFYYSVVFCGIYIKTQWCWFFSSIWSLLWNFFFFSPVYIAVISFIEHKFGYSFDEKVYYMKRTFVF